MRCARRLKLDCGGELTEPDTTRLSLRLPPPRAYLLYELFLDDTSYHVTHTQ
jgi:hypothetical protein